ncbi:MAG: tetratricopeptide repeat protein [Rudaea sp.]
MNPHDKNPHDKRLAIEQLQKGIIQHRAGQLGLAQSHYQRAAKLDPKNPDAWHLLGVCALQTNNLPLAAKHLRTCTSLSPGFAEAHNNLGVALRRMGRHRDSLGAFRAAMAARERYVEAIQNLGLALEDTGDDVEAERAHRQALAWRGNDFDSTTHLAALLRKRGRLEEALPLLDVAYRTQPQNARACGNLATLLIDIGRAADALGPARAACAIEPKEPTWWAALGVAERVRHNIEPAIEALRRALELAPRDENSRAELALALLEAGEVDEARLMLADLRPAERIAERLRWTYELSLPSIYADEAQVDAERERFARGLESVAVQLKLETPQDRFFAYEAASSVATFLLHYQVRDNTSLQNRFGDIVRRVLDSCVPQLLAPLAWRARSHDGRIRVGVVSSHLMNHTVSRYFRALLCGLDPARFEVRVWYGGATRDASTEAIAAKVSSFEYLSEDALLTAGRIRDAQLDALVYPEIGMDPRHQILGALRLAPVQCVLYGHPATSGLANIDHFVSGAALEPDDAAKHYREDLVLLPGLGATPERPPAAADGGWLDRYTDGGPIALCLQNHLKLAPAFDAVLAQIAKRSGMRIGFFIRNGGVARRLRARIEGEFARHGLDPARALVFLPAQGYNAYLGGIARAALVLDPPGFSGGATSLDAFSVGTPVLTWRGDMARGRQTQAMLGVMGVDGLVAADAADYVARAIALLADAAQLALLREHIRRRSSALFDHAGVIEAFEAFLDEATRSAGAVSSA